MPPSSPWNAPVELVPGDPADVRDLAVRTIHLGLPLPGVAAIRLTVGTYRGRELLVAIEPARDVTTGADATLAAALGALGRPVPVLAVGTDLQRRVLAALLAVPAGRTITYGALAARAGAPGASRAAARVMSTNRVPLVLPCHRVVPAGGGIGRYGWGADVKAALLASEGADPASRVGGDAPRQPAAA